MIRFRTASALAAGALAAVAIAGTALAVSVDDGPARRSTSVAASTGPDSGGADSALLDDGSPDDDRSDDDRLLDDKPGVDDNPGPEGSSVAATPAPTVGEETARLIALRAVGGGRVTSIERETEHGRPVYDVRVVRGGARHDLHVDRLTGTVLRHRVDGRGGASSSPRGSDDDGSRHRGRDSDDANGDDHKGRGRGSDD